MTDMTMTEKDRKDKKTREKQQKRGVFMQIVLKTHYRRKKVGEKYCGFKIKL